jgi:hypothetical protein
MSGTLLYSFEIINNTREQGEIELDLSALPGGLFFLRFSGNYMDHPVVEQKKILKTN